MNDVDVIVPTMNNVPMLRQMVQSILNNTESPPRILIVNNGEKGSVSFEESEHYRVIESGGNLGWEGGLNLGLKESDRPYVMFANDDIFAVPGNPGWLRAMKVIMDVRPDVAAVGPRSNFVMGSQHIFSDLESLPYETKLLIGFCVLVRRKALDEVGGVAENLVGGDDFDLSIRLVKAGYKMVIHGGVYVHHWGSITGQREHPGYWNSPTMINETRNELIRRNKLRPYLATLNLKPVPLV